MKTLIIILLLSLTSFINLYGQTVINLSFSGRHGLAYIPTDSIRVHNITQGADTVLYWPDTVLTFTNAGIPSFPDQNSDLSIGNVFPNPSAGQCTFELFMPKAGSVVLEINDFTGRVLDTYEQSLQPGKHNMSLSMGKSGSYLLSAKFNNHVVSTRILNTGFSNGMNVKISYLSYEGMLKTPKSLHAINSFPWAPGNMLKITAYADSLVAGLIHNPYNSEDYFLQFPLHCPGLKQFVYGGQIYTTVLTGSQCWMRENLNIGSLQMSTVNQTNDGKLEKYCYNNDSNNCIIYGGLYQWDEMMQYTSVEGAQGICPPGWHIPTVSNWNTLTNFLGGPSVAGGKMKEAGFAHWDSPNAGGTNESGFTALPGGILGYNTQFFNIGKYNNQWSSSESSPSEAYIRWINWTLVNINVGNVYKIYSNSLRCLKD